MWRCDTYMKSMFVVAVSTIVEHRSSIGHRMNHSMPHFRWCPAVFSFSDFPSSFLCCFASMHQNCIQSHRCHPVEENLHKKHIDYQTITKPHKNCLKLHRSQLLLEYNFYALTSLTVSSGRLSNRIRRLITHETRMNLHRPLSVGLYSASAFYCASTDQKELFWHLM